MKLKKKTLSILLVLALVIIGAVGMATQAGAYASYNALTTPTVSDDTVTTVGTVLIHTTAGAVYDGNPGKVNFRLPTDYKFDWSVTGLNPDANGYVQNLGNLLNTPEFYSSDPNGLYGQTFTAKKISDNEIQINTTITNKALVEGNDGYMYLYLKKITIPSGESGELKLTAIAPSSSGFGSGEVVVAKIVGDGKVALTVDSVETFTDSRPIVLRFKEFIVGSLEADSESVKLRLPDGFEWTGVPSDASVATDVTMLWGGPSYVSQSGLTFDVDGRDLYMNILHGTDESAVVAGGPVYFSVPLTVTVEDESKAKFGDVTVTVSGQSTVDPSSLVVAKYAEMGAVAKCDKPLDVFAGSTEQTIGDIVIEENAGGSLTDGRSVTLALPANAKWGAIPSVSNENDLNIDTSKGSSGWDFVGSDGRTLKFWIKNDPNASEAGKITLEDAEVILAGDVTGDLVVKIGGTANLDTESVTVAKILAPVTATASDKPEVKIGMKEQAAADITITESAAGALIDGENLEVWVGSGISFSDKPKVEVTAGDLDVDVDNIRLTGGDSTLVIPVDGESTVASTIKITGVKFDIDRTVPVGDIKVKVGGLAVNEVNDTATLDNYYGVAVDHYYQIDSMDVFEEDSDGAFPGADEVASAVAATCVTPAPDQKAGVAAFKIGDTKYTVNGEEKTADVAPYIKGDRTYVSLRYVAESLGVSSDNIIWNAADQSVVLIKGDRVVKVTIGSNTMYINGVAFEMDVAPELVDPGRTMLPIRWVGQALGATISWDATTQTVSVMI